MSVLAVVSKAVFEKDARIGGKLVGPGDVWPTALYASQNPGLESLASGGALFLATVRPGDRLWLVGVLESPKKSAKGWSAVASTTPVRDVTALMPQLRFSSGKGIRAEPGKLGMSLQTPRQLTAEDETLLRGGPSAASSSATASPAPAVSPALAWRLDHHRRRKLTTKLTAKERELLEPFMGLLEANDEDEGGMELADVVDGASGEIVALLALWPIEAGALIDVETGDTLADVSELYFDAHGDDALRDRMKAAFAAAPFRFDDPPRTFGGRDTPKQAPPSAPTPDDAGLLAEIRALRADLDATRGGKRDPHEVMRRIGAFQSKLLGQGVRPYPIRRPFELTTAQREWLEIAVDHYEWRLDLGFWGLPWKGAANEEAVRSSPLSRMVGKRPPLALDATVDLEGRPHPLWAILSDVVVGLRPESEFLSAIASRPLAEREAVWRQLASREDRLAALRPRDEKEVQRGWADPKDAKAALERYRSVVQAVLDGLGDRGEAIARELLEDATVPKSIDERASYDAQRLAALEGLARRAKAAGGALDPKYDAVIPTLLRDAGESLVPILSLLPPERAGELTGLAYFLLSEFPSESGMRRLVENIGRDVEWQSPKGDMSKLATKLAGKFPEAALPLLRATKPKLTRHPDGLDKAIEAAEKALAKVGAKGAQPKAKKK